MSILALPDELLEHIVLYADRADLRACALAYSSLRVPSQRLLFRELALKSKESAMRIGTVLRAAPALAAAVRVLVLHGVPGTLCAALGVTLPALHTLRLYGCRSFTADAFVPCALKAIRRLVIANSDFADMGEIANLLCALPNVSALEFADYSIVLAPDAPVLSPAPTPTLALMSLDPRGLVRTQVLNSLSRWLCAPGSRVLARLETLCTNALMYAPSTLTVAPKLLLDAVAPTLKELRVLQHLEEVGARIDTHLPPFPALERFAMNAFEYESLDLTPIGEEAADAVFMRPRARAHIFALVGPYARLFPPAAHVHMLE